MYLIVNMWWCPRGIFIRHNDIFRLPCLKGTELPLRLKGTELSFQWCVYTSCEISGYKAVGAYYGPLVITLGLNAAGNHMLKVNNRNTRARCEICSMLTIKTTERCQRYRSRIFIINFEHISHLVLLNLSR